MKPRSVAILPSSFRSENPEMHVTIEKNTTGATMILSALIYMVLTGVSIYPFRAPLTASGPASDSTTPTRVPAIRAASVR